MQQDLAYQRKTEIDYITEGIFCCSRQKNKDLNYHGTVRYT